MNARNEATSLADRFVQHAARHAPADLAERLEEEWLADLSAQQGWLARLRFALGCCWARQVIAHDALAFGARLRPASAGTHAVHAMHFPQLAPAPRRAAVLLFIVALHVVVIFAFIYGIRTIALTEPPPNLNGTIIDEPRTPPPPPAAPRVHFTPVGGIVIPRMTTPDFTEPLYMPTSNPIATATAGPAHTVVRKPGGPGDGFPATRDFYPPNAIRLGQAGVAAVQVCTDEHGRLTADPQIARTSGSALLDAGALALAKAGSGHYRSAAEDGRPVASCFPFAVRFTLN